MLIMSQQTLYTSEYGHVTYLEGVFEFLVLEYPGAD